MENVDTVYVHWEYITPILYILWSFGIFSPVLVCCTKKNLATLSDKLPNAYPNFKYVHGTPGSGNYTR
jgi:hypothetical protein